MAKEVTREQAATKKQQAAELMERTGQPDRSQEFRSMSVEQYAEHRGLRLTNLRSRRAFMAAETKGELGDKMDELESLIDEALDAELSREGHPKNQRNARRGRRRGHRRRGRGRPLR